MASPWAAYGAVLQRVFNGEELPGILANLPPWPPERVATLFIINDDEIIKKAVKEAIAATTTGGAGTGVSTAPDLKVINVRRDDGTVTSKKLKSQDALDKYLDRNGFIGLLLEGGAAQDVVDDWDELIPQATYVPARKDLLEERVRNIGKELRHLTNRREDEFGNALCVVAAVEEGVPESAASLLPEARLQEEEEVDAVVRVDKPSGAVLYVGSHKTHSDGVGDVNAIHGCVGRVLEWTQTPQAPASVRGVTAVKTAFMPESLGPVGQNLVPKRCRKLGVAYLRRGSGGIIKAQAFRP